MTHVASKSTAVSILLHVLARVLPLCRCEQPVSISVCVVVCAGRLLTLA